MNSYQNNPFFLHGKRIIVTGAASGIGLSTCQLISQSGGRVLAVDIDSERLSNAMKSFHGTGHEAQSLDLREIDKIPSWMATMASSGGAFFGLVHAAGNYCVQPVRLLDSTRYRSVMTINTDAALALARGFQQKNTCDPAGGSIVFISSVMALVGSPGAVAYSMSKAALIGLTKSLSLELASRKIRVNCVAPGFVKTAMLERVSSSWSDTQWASVKAEHPLGIGESEDVANSILFLLANTGKWVTGSVLVVDGGYTAH